jgi:penicillin-binding protein 1A
LKRALLIVAGLLLALGLLAAGTIYFVVEHFSKDLPSVEKLKAGYDPPQITRILAKDGTLLSSLFTERRTVVAFNQVPDAAKLAFLAAEDAGFYEHEGLNYWGMLRAVVANIRHGHSVQGGSSITQQVVKNVLLDAERSYQRKIKESILSLRLEQSLTKDEIFWLYLNHIYLGHGRYGIEEASRYYFGKHTSELALDEAAILAGLIASPERYSPRRDPEKALTRRSYVLEQMLKKGFVTRELYNEVNARPLHLAPTEETESRLAPEMVDQVKAYLAANSATHQSGLTVRTTIDPELQAAARKAVRENLDAFMTRHKLLPPYTQTTQSLWGPVFAGHPTTKNAVNGVVVATDDRTGTIDVRAGDVVGRIPLASETRYNPTHLAPSEFTRPGAILRVKLLEKLPDDDEESRPAMRLELGPQSALVAIDVRTRAVLALVGSYEAVLGGLDRATKAERQPGSTFKPLMYSYALHAHKVTPATLFPIHKPVTGSVERDGQNFLSVRNALAQSNNEVSTQLLRRSGPQGIVDWAHSLGVHTRLEPDDSLALGSYEVKPIELANAFATFASGGLETEPRLITEIETGAATQALPESPTIRVMTADEAYLTTSLLRGVIEYGTGQAAKKLGREIAGKTGTTNESKDAWFVGYSPDIVAVVWVGYDDPLPMGKLESGSKTALPAWIAFMDAAHKNLPKTTFARPPGILGIDVDPATGLLPRPGQEGTRSEEFLQGTEPNEVAPEPAPSVTASSSPDTSSAAPGAPPPAASTDRARVNIPDPGTASTETPE